MSNTYNKILEQVFNYESENKKKELQEKLKLKEEKLKIDSLYELVNNKQKNTSKDIDINNFRFFIKEEYFNILIDILKYDDEREKLKIKQLIKTIKILENTIYEKYKDSEEYYYTKVATIYLFLSNYGIGIESNFIKKLIKNNYIKIENLINLDIKNFIPEIFKNNEISNLEKELCKKYIYIEIENMEIYLLNKFNNDKKIYEKLDFNYSKYIKEFEDVNTKIKAEIDKDIKDDDCIICDIDNSIDFVIIKVNNKFIKITRTKYTKIVNEQLKYLEIDENDKSIVIDNFFKCCIKNKYEL